MCFASNYGASLIKVPYIAGLYVVFDSIAFKLIIEAIQGFRRCTVDSCLVYTTAYHGFNRWIPFLEALDPVPTQWLWVILHL